MNSDELVKEIERLKRRVERERRIREEAETLAERGIRDLYQRTKEIELLQQVALAANEGRGKRETIEHIIDLLCNFASWPVGHVYHKDEDGVLRSMKAWHLSDRERLKEFVKLSEEIVFVEGIGLPGQVLQGRGRLWIPDVRVHPNFPRASVATSCSLVSAFGSPIYIGGEVAAVVEFFSFVPIEPDQRLLDILSRVSDLMGRVIERARAELEIARINSQLEARVIERTKDLQEARHAAERALSAKSDFLANMSHEIRTPLNGILGMTSLVLSDELVEEQRSRLNVVRVSAESLLHIVDDILDLSKIDAGKLNIVPEATDLREAVERYYNPFTVLAVQKGVALSLKILHTAHETIIIDAHRIGQILTNLVGNALKFTPREGRVAVEIEVTYEPCLVIRVHDTGIGIPEDKKQAIFESFTQADETVTRSFGGTGLGLSIVAKLVSLMDGKVKVESVVGKGSCFSVQIPIDFPIYNVKLQKKQAHAQEEKDLTGFRVLVVEDNEINLRVTREILLKSGMNVSEARDGAQAIELLRGGGFDIVLMDCQMPVLDGYSATSYIRNELALKELPIIALTAHALTGERERCLEAGMNDYLPKPFKMSELLSLVRRFLCR